MDRLLAKALANNGLVLIAGTGVSASATDGAPAATWTGFIESGIALVERRTGDSKWAGLQRDKLLYAESEGALPELLSAATSVHARVDCLGPQALANWFRDEIGNLDSKSTDLTDAISALPFPILTTNYDTLLDRTRGSVDWTDVSAVQASLSGSENHIVHLHGVWTKPETAVVTDPQYTTLLASETAMHLQRAASSLKSLIYVGYGAGLRDPNFARLIDWHRTRFTPSGVTHFRICLDSELADLQIEHAGDHIHPLAYGAKHSDMPAFIRSLAPTSGSVTLSGAGIVQDLVGASQTAFVAELIDEAIIGETLSTDGPIDLEDVVLPPVLLPVPHAQFIKARRSANESAAVRRLDPKEEVRGHDCLIIVGDENSGLTTAVKWLALEAARYVGGAVPIYVSFRDCKPSSRPLGDQLAARARAAGVLPDGTRELPPYVLALDDFTMYVPKISERVAAELAKNEAVSTIIACAQGTEDDIVERLKAVGLNPTVRYLGRLSSEDVRTLAKMASPGNHAELAGRVLDVVQNENLPRTPFTITLLLAVLVRSGAFSPVTSQTSILDDYVGLILGRGDPHEDARLGLDQSGREALLGRIAQSFVVARAGGLLETDVIQVMQETFNKLGWGEHPSDVLKNLIERRVLRFDGRHITFTRSSFLHLFIAKRATVDEPFKNRLLSEPLYFATALINYAALFRHDATLISVLAELLEPGRWEAQSGGVFSPLDREEAAPSRPSESEPTTESQGPGQRNPAPADHSAVDRFFDSTDDADLPPFPMTEETDMSPVLRLMRSLELVSNTLRDSDQIEDLSLKKEVLTTVLEHWGVLMSLMSTDNSLRELLRQLLVASDEVEEGDQVDLEEAVEEWLKIFPAAIGMGGISVTLASRRLTVALDRAIDDETIFRSEQSVIGAAFFLIGLQDNNWVERLRKLLDQQGNIWIIRNFLLFLCVKSFVDDRVAAADENALLELCVDIGQRSFNYRDQQHKLQHREQLRGDFTRRRLRARTVRANAAAIGSKESE